MRRRIFVQIEYLHISCGSETGAREPWRWRRRGSPNFLPCGAMLTQHLDHKLAARKAILGWPFLSQLLLFKQLKQTEVLTENSGVIRVNFYPRDAMLARVIEIATCLSVRLSVRPSVTRRYCVKTNKASGMISSPYGSPKTLVFRRQISSPNSKGFPPNGGLK